MDSINSSNHSGVFQLGSLNTKSSDICFSLSAYRRLLNCPPVVGLFCCMTCEKGSQLKKLFLFCPAERLDRFTNLRFRIAVELRRAAITCDLQNAIAAQLHKCS